MNNKHYINGQWTTPHSNDTFEVINPATEQVIANIPAGNSQDINAAVQAARQAFDSGSWSNLSGSERGGYLHKIAQLITDRVDELAKLEVKDNGKPYPEAKWDIEDTAATFSFYGDLACSLDSDCEQPIELGEPGFSAKAIKQPLGVYSLELPDADGGMEGGTSTCRRLYHDFKTVRSHAINGNRFGANL